MMAAFCGRTEMVSAFIQAGVNLDCVDSQGRDAETLAAKFGYNKIAEMLREARAQKATQEAESLEAAIPDAPRA